jgi:hypothetical protein
MSVVIDIVAVFRAGADAGVSGVLFNCPNSGSRSEINFLFRSHVVKWIYLVVVANKAVGDARQLGIKASRHQGIKASRHQGIISTSEPKHNFEPSHL